MTHREHRSFGRSTVKLATGCHSVSYLACRRIMLACLVLGPLLFSMSPVACQEMSPVQKGQTATQVRQKLGPPARISRQILFRRHIEQWHYEAPPPLRIEFNCVHGEEPYVCSILQLSSTPH